MIEHVREAKVGMVFMQKELAMKMMRSRRILGQNRQDEQAKVMKAKHADHA